MREVPGKIYVSENGRATIVCPKCGLTRHTQVDRYRGKSRTIQVKCSCGLAFPLTFEFRRFFRKRTELNGTYRMLSEGGGGQAHIHDISRNGIGFTVSGVHSIKVGQRALLDFTLDNRKQSRLQKEVVVRSVDRNRIGCEFNSHQAFDKDLGFYLQP